MSGYCETGQMSYLTMIQTISLHVVCCTGSVLKAHACVDGASSAGIEMPSLTSSLGSLAPPGRLADPGSFTLQSFI